jgi:hypothetical protein
LIPERTEPSGTVAAESFEASPAARSSQRRDDKVVTELMGESISTRIHRFAEHPEFPFANRLAVPDRPIVMDGVIGGPVNGRMLYRIFDEAYRLYARGAATAGIYEDAERDIVLEWSLVQEPIPEPQQQVGDDRFALEYRLTLTGAVGDERFENWHFVTLRVTEDGTIVEARYWTPGGGFNGKGYATRADYEKTMEQLRRFEDGIPRHLLVIEP